jgi:hypothetical protein
MREKEAFLAKSRKTTTIPDLIEEDKMGPEQAMAALRKHLKSGTGAPYTDRRNYVTDVLARTAANAQALSQAKTAQWRITACALPLLAAVAAAVQLSRHLVDSLAYRAALAAVALAALALCCWVAKKLMNRTLADMSYCRENGKLNEEMLNLATGIGRLAAAVVAARRPELEDRRPWGEEEDNRAVARLQYALVVGAAVIAAGLSALLAVFT